MTASAVLPRPRPHRRLRSRRRLVVLAVALLAALVGSWSVGASSASAHASLTATDPVDGAQLDAAPARVALTFSEPVEVPSGALRVFDADAQRVDVGMVETGDAAVVAVALPDDLGAGGYVVTYRVLSTDAHPIGGVTTFTVGDAPAVDDATLGVLASGTDGGVARPLGMVLRGFAYLATLLAGGSVLFAVAVAQRAPDRAAARRVGRRAAVVGAVVALLAVPVQAVTSTGGMGAAVSVTALGEVIGSTFGTSVLTRATALLGLALLWRPRTPRALPAIAGLVAVTSFALDGHQRSTEPGWLLIGGDVVHLVAAAGWFGGLLLLVGALRRRSLGDDPLEAAGLVARFSSAALGMFALVTVGGIAMAIPLVGSTAALTGTTYGWLLIAKVAAVLVVVLLAFYNRQRLVPAITARRVPAGASVDTASVDAERGIRRSDAAWGQLRRTVRIEAAVLSAVLLLTGVLVATPPASEAAGFGGIYEATAPLGEGLEVDIVVDPNEVGLNAIHLYVLDDTGRPSDAVEELALELTYLPEDIGPIPIEPLSAGPGHWVANSDAFTFAGDWEIRVVAALDRFTERRTEVIVPVAG